MEIIALIYVISLVLAYRGLIGRDIKSIIWAVFIILNILLWALAILTIHDGYQDDASGTAGGGSRLPIGVGVGIITLIYHWFLYISRSAKKT
jgi:hypothetical protein